MASDAHVKLGKITVQMGDTQVDLTIDQARELSALLKGLFGDDSTKIIHVRDYVYPRPWYMGATWKYEGYNWSVSTSNISDSGHSNSSYTLSDDSSGSVSFCLKT